MNRRFLMRCSFILLFLVYMPMVSASVTIIGTRFVYPANSKSKTLQINNRDDFFNVVQLWVDVDNPNSTPDDADAPFVVTPPIFRMEPKAGQNARLIFTGQGLPQDRESVFYLNLLQIPPISKNSIKKNAIHISFRHRMKVFYRPEKLLDRVENVLASQSFSVKQEGNNWLITATNPTSYFATFNGVKLTIGSKVVDANILMVSPKSSETATIENAGRLPNGSVRVDYAIVNDLGLDNSGTFVIQR